MDIIRENRINPETNTTQSATLNPGGGQVDTGTIRQPGYKEISLPGGASAA
jgi:hypothetical protein